MNKSRGSSKSSSMLSEIRKLADEAIELSEASRLQERALSDEAIQLSEKHRLAERADSDKALEVSEEAHDVSEKRRLTERADSDKASKLSQEVHDVSEKRRLTERDNSDEALKVSEEARDVSEKRRLTERDNSDEAFTLEKKRRTTERSQSAEAFTLNKKQSSLEFSLAHQEINKLNKQIVEIIESMHETCLFFYDYHLVYVNGQAQNLYWPGEHIIGKALSELLPNDISEVFLRDYRDDKSPPPIIRFESEKFRANKRFQFFFYPSESGFLVCFNDITTRSQIEVELIQKDSLKASKKKE